MSADIHNSNNIFEGYKALGLISSNKPFIIRYVRKLKGIRIIIPVGKFFHTYNDRLHLLDSSYSHDNEITALASNSYLVFSSCGSKIFAWRNGQKKLEHVFDCQNSNITHILTFDDYVISINESNVVNVWNLNSKECILELPFSTTFEISCIIHPSTYVNKVLLGSKQGSLQLWNIRTQELIYTFNGWGSTVITIEQSPAIDVVAIGLLNGFIIIHNLRYDESLMKFFQEWGPVKSLSFRTQGPNYMVSSSELGHLAIWDLDKRKLVTQKREVHNGPVFGCKYVQGEPLLITSSSDNSIKIWCFDILDEEGRLLHQREGHYKPPTKIRFYGDSGEHILSASSDSTLRCFSVFSERLNKNFGKASKNRKSSKRYGVNKDPNILPPIYDFSWSKIREREWDNIVAAHEGTHLVSTWSSFKSKMGDHIFTSHKFRGRIDIKVSALFLTTCGNFAIIGYTNGHVDRYNVQSGIFRKSYGENGAHEGPVKGIVADDLDRLLITAGDDCSIKFWHFKSAILLKHIQCSSPIHKFELHRESSLLSVAYTDFTLEIIDLDTRKVIRKFGSHSNTITDMAFSFDARWIIVSSMEKSIRVWDLLSSKLIEWFSLTSPCLSLSFSPTGEFLALALQDELGIFLYTNLSLFFPITLRPLSDDYKPLIKVLPTPKIDYITEHENDENSDDQEKDYDDITMDQNDPESLSYKSPEQLSEELITLSELPASRWRTILNLDEIRKERQPKEPIEKIPTAPFFLPTIDGLNPEFFIENKDENKVDNSQVVKNFVAISDFGRLLINCESQKDYTVFFEKMRQLGPNILEIEIRSLDIPITIDENNEENEENKLFEREKEEKPLLLYYFLDAIENRLLLNQDYDEIHSYLFLFLKLHSKIIMDDCNLVAKCTNLLKAFEQALDRIEKLTDMSSCIVNFIRSVI